MNHTEVLGVKKLNPNMNSQNNLLTFTELHAICCGDGKRTPVFKYQTTIDTTSVSTLSNISLGGTEYGFGSAYDTTTEAGRKLIKAAITNAVDKAGYYAIEPEFIVDGNNLTIRTWWYSLVFDYVETNANAFAKIDGMVAGDLTLASRCTGDTVGYLENPTVFTLATLTNAGTTGQVIAIRDEDDNVIVSWVSDGQGANSFYAGGSAWTALSNAPNLDYSFDQDNGTIKITYADAVLKDLYNTTATSVIAPLVATTPKYFVFKPVVSSKGITKVTINDGTTNKWAQAPSFNDSTFVSGDTNSSNGLIRINYGVAGYTGTITFTVTVETNDCVDNIVTTIAHTF